MRTSCRERLGSLDAAALAPESRKTDDRGLTHHNLIASAK